MSTSKHYGLDATVAGLLALVLAGVYWVDVRGWVQPEEVSITKPDETVSVTRKAHLAVTPGTFDRMGPLLDKLGEGYRFEEIEEAKLTDPAECARFDAIFLTCTAGVTGDGSGKLRADPKLAEALRAFVEGGGALYASDLQFETLRLAFPEYVEHKSVAYGNRSERVDAAIVDPDLASVLGGIASMPLHFDQQGWRPAAFWGPSLTVYLRGKFGIEGTTQELEAPLLVKFKHGAGMVIFTSFHNEKANPGLEPELLRYLVLSTVTARLESAALQELERGGFSPKSKSILTTSEEEKVVTRKFEHSQSGPLKFMLGFKEDGARLTLKVVSPTGKQYVESGGSTFTIEPDETTAGAWTYSVTANDVPYPNFAYNMSVAEPSTATLDTAPAIAALPRGPDIEFKVIPLGESKGGRAGPPRIGVTEVLYDDMGKLLRSLGSGYAYREVSDDNLLSADDLRQFDILFLTCGVYPEKWVLKLVADGGRPGIARAIIDPDKLQKAAEALRTFVEFGGTLYASDKRSEMIYQAFPERRPQIEAPVLKVLPYVEERERAWIKARAPVAEILTIPELIRRTKLSDTFKDEQTLQQLIAAIEVSSLVDGNLSNSKVNVPQLVQTELQGIPEADANAIARELSAWDDRLARGYRDRSLQKKQQAQEVIRQAEIRLIDARQRLSQPGLGQAPQTVNSRVVDPGLREALRVEDTIPLKFEMVEWVPARFSGDDITVMMEGEFEQTLGPDDRDQAPLLVKFPAGKGTVIFTSFHNEKVNTEIEEGLLSYLVFSAVTAKEEEAAATELSKGGFSPPERSRLGAHSPGSPSVPGTYITTQPGAVRFALTLGGVGARFKFALRSPDGQEFEREVDSTLIVEAVGAPVGEWTYEVTALKVPFENFPWSVTVSVGGPSGESGSK